MQGIVERWRKHMDYFWTPKLDQLLALAGYGDALWQQSPVSQALSSTLKYIGDDVCTVISNEAWSRRCGAMYYFGASVVENPVDSVVWVGTKVIADPLAGLLKTSAFLREHYNTPRMILELSQAIQEHGWKEGLAQYGRDQWTLIKQTVASDPQIQSFLILAIFLGVASLPIVGPALALLGGIALVGWQAVSTFVQIDKLIQSAATREEAMQYASSKNVRRNVTVTLALAALLAFGAFRGLKEVNQFRAYQESLPPSEQLAFSDLPFWRQFQIYDAAQKLGLSPKALEFYLNESARLGNLPLEQALRVSSLAERSGQGTFVLDYVTRNGEDPAAMSALLNSSPEALSRYADLAKSPNSLLNQITPQEGLQIANGKVVAIDPGLAQLLAKQLSKATGQNAWGSPGDGNIYLSTTSPRAIAALQQLAAEGTHGPNRATLIRVIAEESLRGSGDRLILGPYKESKGGIPITVDGVEQGLYIQQALNDNGLFFDLGSNQITIGTNVGDMWTILKKNNIDPFLVNESTLQIAVENKIPIDFKLVDVDATLRKYVGIPDSSDALPIRVREMRWLMENAEKYDYVKNGNSWIPKPGP